MIYSDDINRVCGLCCHANIQGDSESDTVYCTLKKKSTDKAQACCKKFVYDIFKKQVRRKKRLKNDFSAEDFTL